MSKQLTYYICEQDAILHDFKAVDYTYDGVEYPNVQVCKRCGSVFNFGGYNIKSSQLVGVDLSQYKMKGATGASQQALFARKRLRALKRGRTSKQKAEFQRLLDTLLTEEEEVKAIAPRSIWRMNSK